MTRDEPSLRRRLSRWLTARAAGMLPEPLGSWGDAMRAELEYLDDRAALRWAGGCVTAAFMARLQRLYLLDLAFVRAVAVALLTFSAFDATFPSLLTAAHLARPWVADDLAGLTPGDNYHRLVPLMEAIPGYLHAASIAAAVCFAAAAVLIVRRRGAAPLAIVAGVGLQLLTTVLMRPVIASVGTAANPNPSFLAAVVLPVLLPLAIAGAAWTGSRRGDDGPDTAT